MRMIFDINLTSSLTSITALYKRDDQTNVFCLLLLFALEFVFILGKKNIDDWFYCITLYTNRIQMISSKKKSFLYCYLQSFVLFCWGCETNKKAARMWTWARARVRRTFSFSFMIVLCHEMMYAASNTIWHIKRMMMMYLPKVTLYCSNFMFFLAQWSRVKSLFYFIVLWNNATVLWR